MRAALAVVPAVLAGSSAVARVARAQPQDPQQQQQQQQVTVRGSASGDWTARADERDSVRELTDAASLVEPLPGVHVRRFGGDDSFATLSIRGSSSNEVAVVLAGVPLTGGADPTLDLSTLPLWPGAVARVHRSFAPAVLGPGSLGGTLVLDAPSATSPVATDVWAGVGSFGEARVRVGDVSEAGGGVRVATAVSASRSTNDFPFFNRSASDAAGHDVTTPLANGGHAAANGLASVAVPVHWTGGDGALTITALAQARHQELPGTMFGPTPFAHLDSDRELASAELTGPAGAGAWLVRGWGRREGLHLGDAPGSADMGPTYADQTIASAGAAVGWRGRVAPDATLDARVDASSERYDPGLFLGPLAVAPPHATRVAAGVAVDAEWRTPDGLSVAGSGRVDARSDATSASTRDAELHPTGHVGLELPLPGLTLATHAGATARPPSFIERYGDRGAFVGNPSVGTESAWTVDAGARASRRVGGARVTVELVSFVTWAHDLITFVPTGAYGRDKATNIGKARLAGLELDARGVVGPLEVRASYTGLWTENEAECAAGVGPCQRPPLPARPEHDLVADAVVHVGPASVRAGVDAVSGMFADAARANAPGARARPGLGGGAARRGARRAPRGGRAQPARRENRHLPGWPQSSARADRRLLRVPAPRPLGARHGALLGAGVGGAMSPKRWALVVAFSGALGCGSTALGSSSAAV